MDPREAKIHDDGFDLVKVPITQVRLSPYRGRWYVEYRLKNPRFFIDKWWWYDDSIHSNYCDAIVRAKLLVADKCIEFVKPKKTHVLEVKELL